MNLIYCGSGQFGIPCLDAIKNSPHNLKHIFTQPAHPAGRGRHPKPTPVAQWAQQNNIPCDEAQDINQPDFLEKIKKINPDLIIVIAFGQKISDQLINIPKHKAINVHASLLPKYRGAAPINWVIINGESQTGISIITLAPKMDAGQILAQQKANISPQDNAQTLHDKLANLAPATLLQTIQDIHNNHAQYSTQNPDLVTKAPKLKKEDGFIDTNETANEINNKIRGLWPWPGVQFDYITQDKGRCFRVTIAKAKVVTSDNPQNLPHGTLDENLNLICKKNALQILKIKPAGGKLMPFRDFVNGRNSKPRDCFMPVERQY